MVGDASWWASGGSRASYTNAVRSDSRLSRRRRPNLPGEPASLRSSAAPRQVRGNPMNRLVPIGLLFTAACASSGGGVGSDPAVCVDAVQTNAVAAIAKVYPTLVRIHVVSLEYDSGRENRVEAAGSGAIISP